MLYQLSYTPKEKFSSMQSLVLKAREFAREAHKDQLRRYTGDPYYLHLEEVAGMVAVAGLSQEAIAAAWLHDTIEDQSVSTLSLLRQFGKETTKLVVALTDTPAGPGLNREKRKAMDRDRLARASAEAQSIKCADLISNTSSIVKHDPDFAKVYLPEKRAILEALTRAHPKLLAMAWASLRRAEDDLLQKALSP